MPSDWNNSNKKEWILIVRKLFLDMILIIGILLLILGGGWIYYQNNVNNITVNPVSAGITYDLNKLKLNYSQLEQEPKTREFTIPEGVSSFEVAEILEENNIIEAQYFLQLVERFNLEKMIRAGNYVLEEDSNFIEIINKIMLKEVKQ